MDRLRGPRKKAWRVFVVAIAAASAISAILLYRAVTVNRTTKSLCTVVAAFVARSTTPAPKKGTPGYAYYHAHPAEFRANRRQNLELLHALPCKPPKGIK